MHLWVRCPGVRVGYPALIANFLVCIVGANGTRERKSKDSAQIHRGQVRARGTRRRQKTHKIDFRRCLVVYGPRDPKNRVRHQILRIFVVGELRGMSFSGLMQNCATNRLRQVLLAPAIPTLSSQKRQIPSSTNEQQKTISHDTSRIH